MALRELNLGTSANSGDGDNLRAAATKIKENFAEIYADDYVTSARIADDVALGGNPTTTTQSAGDNSTKIATTAYADNAVATAIDAAPAALDTLNELAASLGDDANFAATMTTSLAGKLSTDAGAVGTSNIADDAVTADKLANSINTEIAANTAKTGITSTQASAITANTAKVTNATHTGDVTGATALTIADGAVITAKIADDAVTADKLADSINTEIAANTAKVTNATHTGDVTGSGALTIADDAVTIAKIADAAIVTEAEGIASNDNDTTLPTSAAVKDYVDGAVPTYTDFYVTGNLGRDANDYITWTDDTQMDFYVNGSTEMRLEADGDLHVDGDVIAASTTVSSDEKLKDNIKPIFAPLETLEQIKGVDFNWKKDGSKSSGVIAQDIQKVMPHLVKEVKSLDSDDSHLTVDYNGLIGVLIQAVKELKAEVETLKN